MAQNNINYRTTHIVVDSNKDEENLIYDKPKESQVPTHSSLNFVLTGKMKSFELNSTSVSNETHQNRYFSSLNSNYFQNGKVKEKYFRKMSNIFQNYIPLSHFPFNLESEVIFFNFYNKLLNTIL